MAFIYDDSKMREWILESLDKVRDGSTIAPDETITCSCGRNLAVPVVVRQSDIDNLQKLMRAVFEAMDRYGITVNLLAEIHAQIAIAKASREN